MVLVAVIILRVLNPDGVSADLFAGLNDSVRSKRPIDPPVLHEHRV